MKLAIFAYTKKGCETARKILNGFPFAEKKAFAPKRICGGIFSEETESVCGDMFLWADLIIYVAACGIAVRKIAPFVRSKCTDPAVVCVDEAGGFAIPLLSGHIGGANEFAKETAACIGALCVVTTATDINSKFSPDVWAKKNGFIIDDMQTAKFMAGRILEEDVPVLCDFNISSEYPSGLCFGKSGDAGIYIGVKKDKPFGTTLGIITPVLHLGIGCRRGTDVSAIREAADAVLEKNNIDKRAIKCAASIDIKADEAGIAEYCAENNLSITFFSAKELAAAKGEFSTSDFVKSVTGVDNICERAAITGADRLTVKKTVVRGVTIAVAEEYTEVSF